MWVESTHNTFPTCVAAGTWVNTTCVVRNVCSMRANSTRPSRVTHGTHNSKRFFFTTYTTTHLMCVQSMRESRINTLQAEVHARDIIQFRNNTRKVTHLNVSCFYSNMADNHCIVEIRETSSLALRAMRNRFRHCWHFQSRDRSVHHTVVDPIVVGSDMGVWLSICKVLWRRKVFHSVPNINMPRVLVEITIFDTRYCMSDITYSQWVAIFQFFFFLDIYVYSWGISNYSHFIK